LAAVLSIIIVVSLVAAYMILAPPAPQTTNNKKYDWVLKTRQQVMTGYGMEQSNTSYIISINETNIADIQFILTWNDEPSARTELTNQSVIQHTTMLRRGNRTIVVSIGDCGDQQPILPDPSGLRTVKDTGNAYTLTTIWNYYEQVERRSP